MNYTYILKCKDDSLYTGWTNDLKSGLQATMPGREPSIQKPEDRWNWSTMKNFRQEKRQ